jgi:general secretion pathway protein C
MGLRMIRTRRGPRQSTFVPLAGGRIGRHVTAMIVRDDSPMGTRARLLLELRQRGPQVAALLIAALIVVDGADSGWALRSYSNAPADDRVGPVLTQARRAGPDVQQITAAHLFGAAPVERSPGSDNAPDTRLALTLTGIIALKDPDKGYAILAEEGKPAHLYATGAVVAGTSARVQQVFSDRVVLERQGELETLRLPRSTLVGLVSSGRTDTADASRPDDPAAAFYDQNHPSPAQGFFNYLGAEQSHVDGKLAGLIVHPPKAFQRKYGLQDGDLLTAINGVQISDPDALADLLRTAGGSLSVTLTRDGAQQTKMMQLNN